MAKKKKFGAILEKQTKQIPVVKQKAPKTISTNVSTDGMRSAVSSTTQNIAKSARQKAEEERSARMRQGLSSVVRSSFNRQMSRPTYINKNTVNRLNQLNKTVTNPLAPIKQKQVTGGNGVGGQRLFSKERSLLNNTKFVTGGQGVGGKTVVNSQIGRVKSSVLAPVKKDIQNNYYDAVRKVGMKGSRNERKVYVPLSQRDENGQISTNQRRLENAAQGGNRKAQVEAALARTKAQTLNGHTYDQYVNAELNKKGLLGQDYILRSKDPSKEAMDYRKRYGFDKEALEAVQAIANNTPASGDYTERFNGQDNGSAIDRLKFGFGESYRARNIEDTLRRQYGVELSDEDQAKLDAVRDSGGYMVGNMLGQASQFAMTAPLSPLVEQGLMARMGLKGGRAAINTTKDAVKYAIARIGADQVVSAPVNMIDALKGEDTKDVAIRFFYNTGLDILFGGLMEIPSLRTNSKFIKALRANDAANAMEEGAEQVAAKVAAEKQLSEAISSFNPAEQRAIRNRMRQLAEEADIQRDISRGFSGDTSASNLDIYNEELPSELSRNEARRLVDTEPTPNELVRERAGNFRENSEMLFQDGGIASREAVNASIRHGVQDGDYLNWRMAYDAARRNGMVEDDAIRYADDYLVSSAERARLVNREPVDTLAVANEEARGRDVLLNAANGRETRDSLLDAANNRENRDALLDAANSRRANEQTVLSEGEVPRSNGTFGRDVTAKYNESLEADKNLEQAIANYDKPLTELFDEESKLWDDTYGEAYRRYSEYPDARQRAMQEADDAVKQRRNIELAQAATRADEAQRAINDLHRTSRETVAEEPTVPREEPVMRTEPKRKKVEEPKQTQTPNNNGEVDGSAVYNTNGGINNGAEQVQPRERAGESDIRENVGETSKQGRPEENPTGVGRESNIGEHAGTSGNGSHVVLNESQRKTLDDAGVTNAHMGGTDHATFSNALSKGRAANKYGSYVDPQSVKNLRKNETKTFLSDDGMAGIAVEKDGNIVGAFKNPNSKYGNSVKDMLLTARVNGGTKMDCYGEKLVRLYEDAGYVPVARVDFNASFVDDPLLLKNEPPIYVMMKNADDIDSVIRKTANGEYSHLSKEELDALPTMEYEDALNYRDGLLKQQDSPKDGLGRDIFNGQQRYKPSGAGRDEKFWRKVTKKYEKKSTAWLNAEKLSLPSKVTKNDMGKSEMIERSKLIDSLIDEKARYRHGTLKEVDGTKVSQAYDTLSHSDKTKRIRDELQRTFIDEGTGRKQGMNPKQAAEDAVARVENDPDAIRLKLIDSNDTALKGKFPAKYDNSQEYYADALAYLNHNDSLMEQLEEQGLKNTSQYESLKSDSVKITNGVMAYRSSEGYGAIQYNMLCRSSGEMRVAVVQNAVDDINRQFEKQLEKAAKKEGKKLTEKDKIRIKLTDDAIKKLKDVNPDSPLEMSKAMHEISEDIWNQVPASFKEEADAIRMTSMLLNPKTHIRNFVGNAFMIPARIMKDILGAPLEKAATKIKFRGESVLNPEDATKAVVNRFSKKDKPYFDAAKQVWEEWKDYVRGDMKFFDTVTPTASRLLGSRPIGGGKVFTAGRENPAAWRRVADAIINFNGRLLEGSDALFLKYHFTDSFAQVCKARNLDPTKLTSQELQEVISAATGEAQRATFRDVSEAAKLINGLKASKPDDALIKKGVAWATSTTMPFVNTPINVLRRSWDYSPAGLIHGCAEIVQGVGKGNSKEVKKGIDRLCSGLTGSGICIVGFLLGRDGGLTAKLSEGSEGYYEQDQGFQEYSANIEGKDGIDIPFLELENEDGVSVSLSSFAPLVIPLFTGVEVANWWDDDKEVDWSAVGRAADTIGRIFDPTMDMSVMQGPMSVLKAAQDADSLKTAPVDVGLNIAINHYMQYIPTAFGQAARIADPVRRDLSSTKSSYFDKQLEKAKLKFQSKIPSTILTDNALYNVSSTGIQPYKDTWGREQVTFGDSPVKRFFYETLSPSYIREKNITELDEEITRLNKAATQEEKIIPTKFFGNEVSFNGGKIGVDRKDMTVYNEFRGKSAYAAASKLIDTDGYKTASDSEKRKMLDEVFKEANTEGKQNMLLSKGYSAKKVYTDGFDGGKLENADNAFNAGVEPKDYYKLMTDKSVDLDGNGSKTQYEVYTYLQNSDLTEAQKAAIWNSYNKGWKNNPYAGGTIPTADGSGSKSSSGSSKRSRSGRRSSGGGSSKAKARAKTASEKRFAALQTGKAPTNAKGIEALSNGAKGLTKAQKKALIKMMQKKLDV